MSLRRAGLLVAALAVPLPGCVAREPAAITPPPPRIEAVAPTPSAVPAPSSEAPEPAASSEPSGPPPLEAPAPYVDLAVPGHEPALVVLPLGARGPRPVFVATHGAGGRAEPHCAFWRPLVADRGFLLCPRGRALNPRDPPEDRAYFYPHHFDLGKEVTAALTALAARFPDYVDLRDPIYAGFSQGATMGVLFFAAIPGSFRGKNALPGPAPAFARAILVEGGTDDWSNPNARAWAERGAKRALFVCGRDVCAEGAKRSAAFLKKAGVAPRVEHAQGAGHTYGGAVADAIKRSFSWVLEGDPRWE